MQEVLKSQQLDSNNANQPEHMVAQVAQAQPNLQEQIVNQLNSSARVTQPPMPEQDQNQEIASLIQMVQAQQAPSATEQVCFIQTGVVC